MGYTAIAEAIFALAMLGAAGYAGHKLTADHYEGVIAKHQVEEDKALADANQKAANAAVDWQAWAEVQPAKIVFRDRKVADAFKADPVWAAASLPSGVRDQLTAAAAGADPGQPDSAVPAAAAASAGDERGSRSSLSRVPGFIRELFAPAPGAGASGAAGVSP